jgi:hypothetical protein
MYMSKENHLCSKQQHLVHGFPVRSELVFESNASMNSQLPRLRKAHFLPNRPMQLS